MAEDGVTTSRYPLQFVLVESKERLTLAGAAASNGSAAPQEDRRRTGKRNGRSCAHMHLGLRRSILFWVVTARPPPPLLHAQLLRAPSSLALTCARLLVPCQCQAACSQSGAAK